MLFPIIDKVAFYIGPFEIKWYALAYVVGILAGCYISLKIVKKFDLNFSYQKIDDYVTWLILGIIIGGRMGYVLIYDPIKYFSKPIEILKIYEGGMSFHGGFIGCAIATYLFCKKYSTDFLKLCDLVVIVAPIGIFFGRIANFINSELYGRVTDVPWAIIFPYSDNLPRHPSQLYEALLEGIVIFIVMLYCTFKKKLIYKTGTLTSIFCFLYGLFRFITEIFREPDFHLGFILGYLSMGQILSIPMLIIGIYIFQRIKNDN
mgnify:CR=1 FL=1